MRKRRVIYIHFLCPRWDLIGWIGWSWIEPIFSKDTEEIAKLNPLSSDFWPTIHFWRATEMTQRNKLFQYYSKDCRLHPDWTSTQFNVSHYWRIIVASRVCSLFLWCIIAASPFFRISLLSLSHNVHIIIIIITITTTTTNCIACFN